MFLFFFRSFYLSFYLSFFLSSFLSFFLSSLSPNITHSSSNQYKRDKSSDCDEWEKKKDDSDSNSNSGAKYNGNCKKKDNRANINNRKNNRDNNDNNDNDKSNNYNNNDNYINNDNNNNYNSDNNHNNHTYQNLIERLSDCLSYIIAITEIALSSFNAKEISQLIYIVFDNHTMACITNVLTEMSINQKNENENENCKNGSKTDSRNVQFTVLLFLINYLIESFTEYALDISMKNVPDAEYLNNHDDKSDNNYFSTHSNDYNNNYDNSNNDNNNNNNSDNNDNDNSDNNKNNNNNNKNRNESNDDNNNITNNDFNANDNHTTHDGNVHNREKEKQQINELNDIKLSVLSLVPIWALGSLILELIESRNENSKYLEELKNTFNGPLFDFFSDQIVEISKTSKLGNLFNLRIPSCSGIIESTYVQSTLSSSSQVVRYNIDRYQGP